MDGSDESWDARILANLVFSYLFLSREETPEREIKCVRWLREWVPRELIEAVIFCRFRENLGRVRRRWRNPYSAPLTSLWNKHTFNLDELFIHNKKKSEHLWDFCEIVMFVEVSVFKRLLCSKHQIFQIGSRALRSLRGMLASLWEACALCPSNVPPTPTQCAPHPPRLNWASQSGKFGSSCQDFEILI